MSLSASILVTKKKLLIFESFIYLHTYLAQTPEIGQGLGRFLFHDKLMLP